jgi:hypothetical protein
MTYCTVLTYILCKYKFYSTPEDGYIVAETCSDSKYRNFVYTLLHIDGITQFAVIHTATGF